MENKINLIFDYIKVIDGVVYGVNLDDENLTNDERNNIIKDQIKNWKITQAV